MPQINDNGKTQGFVYGKHINLKSLSGFVKRHNVRSFFIEIGCLGTDNVV